MHQTAQQQSNPSNTEINIQHRRKAEIDATARQLDCYHLTPSLGLRERIVSIDIVRLTERAHRRNTRKSTPETLHASAFMVDADQQRRRPQRADIARKFQQLRPGHVVARKKDRTADEWMEEAG